MDPNLNIFLYSFYYNHNISEQPHLPNPKHFYYLLEADKALADRVEEQESELNTHINIGQEIKDMN